MILILKVFSAIAILYIVGYIHRLVF